MGPINNDDDYYDGDDDNDVQRRQEALVAILGTARPMNGRGYFKVDSFKNFFAMFYFIKNCFNFGSFCNSMLTVMICSQ